MTEQQTTETPAAPATVSGKKVAVFSFLGLLVIALFTYFGIPKFVEPYYEAKPKQTSEALAVVAEALETYYADQGALPPVDEMRFYRRNNKNLIDYRIYGITTYQVSSITTPVAYLNQGRWGDPYAMPAQSAPMAYHAVEFDGEPVAVIWSPGPNLQYDLRPYDLNDHESIEELVDVVTTLTYDPTNGLSSWGDYPRIVRFSLESETESVE